MKTKRAVLTILATAAALSWPALGSDKTPVQKPFYSEANVVWTFEADGKTATGYDVGVATHIGSYVNISTAIWDLNPATFGVKSAEGVLTAANGDQAFWRVTEDKPGVVQPYGGTGRFENLTGEFISPLVGEPILVFDEATGALKAIILQYKGDGWIAY